MPFLGTGGSIFSPFAITRHLNFFMLRDHPIRLLAVFTTVPSRQEARRIASALVERHLVACAQISEIESFYHWHGNLEQESEYRLLLKTTEAQYATVEETIRALHSYELPAIHAVAIDRVYPPYAAWVEAASRG